MKPAKLQFREGNPSGFPAGNISQHNDLNPFKFVRELIQNSVDAAKEAKVDKAKVTFSEEKVSQEDVPGIEEYRKAFKKAKNFMKNFTKDEMTDQANNIIASIEDCLSNKNSKEFDVLTVLDNGIGLDDSSLSALLSDGFSRKESEFAAGSYGNGHLVAIPTSDLRYLLYAGINTANGITQKIFSGHTILSSFSEEDKLRSGDGHFVKGYKNGEDGSFYDFPKDEELPKWINRYLNKIEKKWQHGSAIIIPGFNKFNENEDFLWDTIFSAAACNFFAAIENDELEVRYFQKDKNPKEKILDKDSIYEVLERKKDKKKQKGFISGKRAYQAWKVIKEGKLYDEVKTSSGNLRICLLPSSYDEKHHIDICRNGMWVTDERDVPRFKGKFSKRATISCCPIVR